MIYLLFPNEFNISREILIRFCRQFEYPIENPMIFYAIHLNQIRKYPELSHFGYQYAIEAVCRKHLVHNTDLMTMFNDNIPIIDMYRNLNKGLSDASTFNSLMIMEQINRIYGLFPKGDISIVSTPLEYQTRKYYDIQLNNADTREYVRSSRATTHNTNAKRSLYRISINNIKRNVHNMTVNTRINYAHIVKH